MTAAAARRLAADALADAADQVVAIVLGAVLLLALVHATAATGLFTVPDMTYPECLAVLAGAHILLRTAWRF